MKKLIALAVSAMLLISLTACGGEKTSEITQNQETPTVQVKKVPVRSELYDMGGNLMANISYEYTADSKLISNTTTWVDSWGGSSETDTYTYSADGYVTSKTTSYSDSDYASVRYYEYDQDGNLVKEYFEPDYGTRYVYHTDGRISESYNYNSGGETLWQTYSYTDATMTQTEVWDDWVFEYITHYDSNGNILKWVYNCNGENMINHNYTYDGEGNLTRQDVSIEGWKMEGYVVHYYE